MTGLVSGRNISRHHQRASLCLGAARGCEGRSRKPGTRPDFQKTAKRFHQQLKASGLEPGCLRVPIPEGRGQGSLRHPGACAGDWGCLSAPASRAPIVKPIPLPSPPRLSHPVFSLFAGSSTTSVFWERYLHFTRKLPAETGGRGEAQGGREMGALPSHPP